MQRGKIFRKGSSWHLRYKAHKYVDGKKIWWTTSTKLADVDLQHRTQQSVEDDAEKFLKGLNPVKPVGTLRKGVKTFKDQSEIWIQGCQTRQRKPIKPATLKNWKSHLNVHILPVIGNMTLPDVSNKTVKDFVATLKLAPKSVNNVVQVIKMVRGSALDEEGNELYPIKWNHDFIDMPTIKAREQHQPSFTPDQIEKIVEKGGRRVQMLTVLLAASGLRAGELFGLEVEHFDGSAVHVKQEAWNAIIQAPKTDNAIRSIELDPRVAKLLKEFLAGRTSGYVFGNGGGKPIHQSNFLRREFHPILKAAQIPKAGFHGFRRYRNTFLRNVARCPDGLLKYWLGHAHRDMSDVYDRVREDAKFRLAEAKKAGTGFKVPKRLKPTAVKAKTKSDKNVVRLVVRDSESNPAK
jgi:integrase